jgi:Zn-finger nucleic acid-binding protein
MMCDQMGKLRDRVGAWTQYDAIRWWFDNTTDRLYEIQDNRTLEYSRTQGKTRTQSSRFALVGESRGIPSGVFPATAFVHHGIVQMTGTGQWERTISPSKPLKENTWVAERLSFPDYIDIMNPEDIPELVGVSDGSFKNKHGTAAWILKISEDRYIHGGAIAPGPPESQCAYRSELTGLYGIAFTIWYLETNLGWTSNITVGCDGLSALQQVSRTSDFINPNTPHFDLILATRAIIARTKWSWKWVHVKGHQDATKDFQSLDEMSRLNVQMDTAAKQLWTETVLQSIDPKITGEPWRVSINNNKITSAMGRQLREFTNMTQALQYWNNKHRFGSRSASDVDWTAFGAAMQALPPTRRRWVSKTVSGFCATGRMMFRRKEWESDQCPRCKQANETTEHVWQCRQDTDKLWTKAMEDLRQWFQHHQTNPEFAKAIIEHLNDWRNNVTRSDIVGLAWAKPALEAQTNMGWKNFFEGFLAVEWQQVQARHFSRIGSKKSTKRWASALIRKLWQVAWDLWEHRNGFVHERDAGLLSEQINRAIQEEFLKGTHNLDTSTKALFRVGFPAVVNKPLEIRVQWVKRVQLAREILRAPTQAYAKERKLMATWLHGS